MKNEARSCSMDLTMSKPLTLDNVKAGFSLYSLNRAFRRDWVSFQRSVCPELEGVGLYGKWGCEGTEGDA